MRGYQIVGTDYVMEWEAYNKQCLIMLVQTRALVEDIRWGKNLAVDAVYCVCCLKKRCIPSDLLIATRDVINYIYSSGDEPVWFERLDSVA